jgi:nitroreductase
MGGATMIDNPVIRNLMSRKSIRAYTDQSPTDEEIQTVLRAGQQAPFASQMYSVVYSRHQDTNPFRAPVYFILCLDAHKFEQIMAKRDWTMKSNDLYLFLLGLQDTAYMGGNMVTAAESLGMGSCYLGAVPHQATAIAKRFNLPKRVFPLVGLTMGFPAQEPPVRPRYPLGFTAFEDTYPDFSNEQLEEAMNVMDEGYLAQDYYRSIRLMLPLEDRRPETFDFSNYSWIEHICRKWGQWDPDPAHLIAQLAERGFDLTRANVDE